MNEEDKISKRLLLIMFAGCLILLVAVAFAVIVYSPKTFTPVFSEAEEESVPESAVYKENDEQASSENSSSENNAAFPIEINKASSEELQLIPGIGPKTAKLILDYRNEYGTIVTFRELLSIDGIGEKTVELLEEHCIIN